MNKGNLKHCLNYTKLLIDFMHPLIQDIQDLDPFLAFEAIEAQNLLMRTEVLLKNPPNKVNSVVDKDISQDTQN